MHVVGNKHLPYSVSSWDICSLKVESCPCVWVVFCVRLPSCFEKFPFILPYVYVLVEWPTGLLHVIVWLLSEVCRRSSAKGNTSSIRHRTYLHVLILLLLAIDLIRGPLNLNSFNFELPEVLSMEQKFRRRTDSNLVVSSTSTNCSPKNTESRLVSSITKCPSIDVYNVLLCLACN